MRKRLFYGFASVLLAISVAFFVWQGSFHLTDLDPASSSQTLILSAVSLLIFILMVTVGWILAREFIKLYVARQAKQPGSRIRTKLVIGAILLSCVPVFFLVLWSYWVLNLNLNAWFTNPTENQVQIYTEAATHLISEVQARLAAQAELLGVQPEIRRLANGGGRTAGVLERYAKQQQVDSIVVLSSSGVPLDSWGPPIGPSSDRQLTVHVPLTDGTRQIGVILMADSLPVDAAKGLADIRRFSSQWAQIRGERKRSRDMYRNLMILITLFVLFVATWLARILANRISVPVAAILEAAGEVQKGNLHHRVHVSAEDELAMLVKGFNQMTEALEKSARELERRSRFTEAILESIPTGVISIGADGSILRVNQALGKIFSREQIAGATRLEDLFSREDTAEIKYLMKRARRTGSASREIELRTSSRKLHLAVTVNALESKLTSGFVLVLEDTSELLRAQKAAAWHEVARRVAHEIKNPLTPIALSAERIQRQIDRVELPPGTARIVNDCAATISRSVESVKTLVDEFSQFARFPAAQPVRSDLNGVVEEALSIFHGRLEGIQLRSSFAVNLPAVNLDREQFQRVVVNLVDNAAEAMQDSLVKTLYVATQAGPAETVEVIIADSGSGVSPDDKEKLFLPYFSTKNRGTGLGLAIVSHIVAEHNGRIRVDDNLPVGARFTIELPALIDEQVDVPSRPAALKV
jgi:two-component system, NtrC family, nitrogen regulation sensor histidine kinase NtrY